MIVNINSMLQYLTAFPLLEFKKQTILAGNTSQNPQFPHQNRLVKSAVSEAPEHYYRLLSMTMTNYHSLGSPFHRQPETGFSEAARGGIFRGSQKQDFQRSPEAGFSEAARDGIFRCSQRRDFQRQPEAGFSETARYGTFFRQRRNFQWQPEVGFSEAARGGILETARGWIS